MKIQCDESAFLGPYNEKSLGVGQSGRLYPTKKMLFEFLKSLPHEVQGEAKLWSLGRPDGSQKIVLEIEYVDRKDLPDSP